MGKHKYIETPEKMWELFEAYKKEVKDKPFLNKDWVGKEAKEIKREYPRVLTMEGFECYVMDHTNITYPDLTEYFEEKNESYAEYFPISSRVRREIRRNQIEMGMANLANPSITQRLNGLVDKQDIAVRSEQPLFGDENK